MKLGFHILFSGVLMLTTASVNGDDGSMEERAKAIMAELNVVPASDHELPINRDEIFPIQTIKEMDNLVVHQIVMSEGVEMAGSRTWDKVLFSCANGQVRAVADIEYSNSAKGAQDVLFMKLAMNSLPLELLLGRYELIDDGPGDICIAETTLSSNIGKSAIGHKQVHFIRGNIAVSLRSKDIDVMELSKLLDQVFIGKAE